MAPTEGSKLLGKLSRGFTTGVQTGVSSLMSVNALLQDAAVRQKAGELISRTAKQVLPEQSRKARARRRKVQQEETECDLQVGNQVYERVPLYMRTQLWKSLLIHADAQRKTTLAERADEDDAPGCDAAFYDALQERNFEAFLPDHKAPGWEGSCAETIFKDVRRTFPGLAMFAGEDGVLALWRVLRAYSIHDPQVGYCQGMNFVAGLLLLHLDEGSAFAALTLLLSSKGAGMRGMYAPSMELLHLRLRLLAKLLFVHAPKLHAHLDRTGASIVIFTSPWLLSVFASEFPMNFAGRVMDMLMAERSFAVVLRVALELLMEAQEHVLALHDLEAVVNHFKREVPNWSRERLNKVLNAAADRADITDRVLATFVEQFTEEDVAAAASRPAARNATTNAAAAESSTPETVPIHELLGEVTMSSPEASGEGLCGVGGGAFNATHPLASGPAGSSPGSLLLDFDAPAIKQLILDDYWSDKDDGLDDEELDDRSVSPRVARRSEYGGGGEAALASEGPSGRAHRGSHTVQVKGLSSGSWRLVEAGRRETPAGAHQTETGFVSSNAGSQPKSSYAAALRSAASVISSPDPVPAPPPPSQSQSPPAPPPSEGVDGHSICGAASPAPAAAPMKSAVQHPPEGGGLPLDLISFVPECTPCRTVGAHNVPGPPEGAGSPDLGAPTRAHRPGPGAHATPPLLDVSNNNNNNNNNINNNVVDAHPPLPLGSCDTNAGSETWLWAQADEELSQNQMNHGLIGCRDDDAHVFGEFVQGGAAHAATAAPGPGPSSSNCETGSFVLPASVGDAETCARQEPHTTLLGKVQEEARALCGSQSSPKCDAEVEVEVLRAPAGAGGGVGASLQGGGVPVPERKCSPASLSPGRGRQSDGPPQQMRNQQSRGQSKYQQMQSSRPQSAVMVRRPPTSTHVSDLDSGGGGASTDPRRSATCEKLGHGSAANPLLMQPLPVELFSEVAGQGRVEPQHVGEPVVELFGDFVDIGEELRKGKHEELGYSPCGAGKRHL